MRKQLFTITRLGLFLTLAVASVHAQSRTKIEATIPFDFTVGEMNLKAGVYSLKFISPNALLLRSADAKKNAIILAPRVVPADTKSVDRLVFHQYGNRYFLAQVWMLRTAIGRELNPSNAERALMRAAKLMKANAKSTSVEVAAAPK